MSVISITFHCIESRLSEWDKYANETLTKLTENLMDADHYILSAVESDMVQEGKNYNLLLIFANEDLREDFIESELVNIVERIRGNFVEDVMIFTTKLNPILTRISP